MEQNKNWRDDAKWVSPCNFADEVRAGMHLPARVRIHDSTLRDGEQTPGVVFSKEEKVEIARLLSDLGVDSLEAGMPAVSQDDFEAVKEIAQLGLEAEVFAFCRAKREDIDRSVLAGAKAVVIEIASGDPKILHQYKWDREEVVKKSVDTVNYAKDKGLKVCYFPFDTTRADFDFLRRLLETMMRDAKPDSMGVVDTTGSCTPAGMRWLVREIQKIVDVPLEVHAHMDFGMGTATSLAAVEEGVGTVQVCLNGLGERCGNTPLEEVAMALEMLYGVETSIKTEKLLASSRRLEQLSNFPLARNKAVVGDVAFKREIGIGMRATKEFPLATFSYLPRLAGQECKLLLGKKSGKESIQIRLEELGIALPPESVAPILEKVKALGIEKKRSLTDAEFLGILDNFR